MKTIYQTLILILLPLLIVGQTVKNADFISPVEDGFAAFKVGNQWGFMDETGTIVLDLRNDLVANEETHNNVDLGVASQMYPVMLEERSIIKKSKDGIDHYGFIDVKGDVVIAPRFLNVSNFKDGYALALEPSEEVLGQNVALGKRVVNYYYNLVLIDTSGKLVKYLCGPFPFVYAKDKLKNAPPIVAKDVGEKLIAVRNPEGKWEVVGFE
ncbi:MAG: WG repeat-containing protein [Flavobacteriaceae bacterium]